MHTITIEWEGPLSVKEVIDEKTDGGISPDWDGDDYGLYQIYGKHILCGKNTLLYIGKSPDQTFSERIKQHDKDFLRDEEDIEIYLGRVFDPERHNRQDDWKTWHEDIDMAERIMLYKYCPNYNSQGIAEKPSFPKYDKVKLVHQGAKNRLQSEDIAPDDF